MLITLYLVVSVESLRCLFIKFLYLTGSQTPNSASFLVSTAEISSQLFELPTVLAVLLESLTGTGVSRGFKKI